MRSASEPVDVVVISHGRADLTLECLDRLEGQVPAHDVTIVDTAGRSDFVAAITGRHPDCELVAFPDNRGFSAAANLGIGRGSAEAVVLLNDDLLPEPGFVAELVEPLRADSEIGMVAALLLRPDGAVDSFGLEMDSALAGYPRLWGADPAEARRDGGRSLGPTGAAAAYRRFALTEVGGFDERLPAYGEDRDLAIRLRLAGWAAADAEGARAVHLGSATFGARSDKRLRAIAYSRGFLLRKYGVMRNPRRALRVAVCDGSSVMFQLLGGRTAGLRGRVAGWRASHRELAFPRGLENTGISTFEGIARRRRYRG